MSENGFLKKLFSKFKSEYLIVIILAVVCIAVVFSGFFSFEKKDSNDDVDEYVKGLEDKLEKSLSLLSGAGKVTVIISVESGKETVLATVKTNEQGVSKEEPFTVGGKTVVLTETYPKISGVVIVAEGANNLSVRVSIINAASVFLNVNSDKIQILPMKK